MAAMRGLCVFDPKKGPWEETNPGDERRGEEGGRRRWGRIGEGTEKKKRVDGGSEERRALRER